MTPIVPKSIPDNLLQPGPSTSVLNTADTRPVVTSEIAQIPSLYGSGFLALKWKLFCFDLA